MQNYEFVASHISEGTASGSTEINVMPVPQSHERCFRAAATEGCIADVRYGFWLDITNRSDKPIRLVWPHARYVDELGKTHELFAPDRGDLTVDIAQVHLSQTDTLRPGEKRRPTVMPIYKQYMVGCKDPELFSEPLVPTRLDDKDEIATKRYVEDLAKRQVPVKLLLPVEIESIRYEYTFTFVLRPR